MSTDMDAATAMHTAADGDYDAAAAAATGAADAPPQPTLFLDALPYLDQQDPQTAEQVQSLLNEGASQQRVHMQGGCALRVLARVLAVQTDRRPADCAALPPYVCRLSASAAALSLLQRCLPSRALRMTISTISSSCVDISRIISNL